MASSSHVESSGQKNTISLVRSAGCLISSRKIQAWPEVRNLHILLVRIENQCGATTRKVSFYSRC